MKYLIAVVGCKQPYFRTSFVAGGELALNTCNGGKIKYWLLRAVGDCNLLTTLSALALQATLKVTKGSGY